MAQKTHLTVGELMATLSHLPLDTVVIIGIPPDTWWENPAGRSPATVHRRSWWMTPRSFIHLAYMSMFKPKGASSSVLVHPDEQDGDKPIVILSACKV